MPVLVVAKAAPRIRRIARAKGEDPYDVLRAYLRAKGLQNNKRGMSLEVYRVHKPVWPDEVDVYIPLL
ncbi:hypothetical protein GXP70_19170 [Paenibacillus lycopersici]|uniref:Uncharacterized protein n=1 Tax=Paenibacillus lycopersici TaxID=2704462 RepID=A0A6C0G3E1_9BACL|nr:hypothetical protein [Paenibacillus lycopersici]QHT61894.1 hypothetical protein GXP70_19170 [Paenibacillus lycopersici]